MATKGTFTKRGDTEMLWTVNMNITGATVKAFAKDETGTTVQLPAVITDAATGKVTITTTSLTVGKYNIEVEVTLGGKVATFPNSGYVPLTVVQDLG